MMIDSVLPNAERTHNILQTIRHVRIMMWAGDYRGALDRLTETKNLYYRELEAALKVKQLYVKMKRSEELEDNIEDIIQRNAPKRKKFEKEYLSHQEFERQFSETLKKMGVEQEVMTDCNDPQKLDTPVNSRDSSGRWRSEWQNDANSTPSSRQKWCCKC